MTSEQAEKLIALALGDAGFLARLIEDPKAAAGSQGIALTDDEASTLSGMSADEFQAFADEYRSATDPSKRRAAC